MSSRSRDRIRRAGAFCAGLAIGCVLSLLAIVDSNAAVAENIGATRGIALTLGPAKAVSVSDDALRSDAPLEVKTLRVCAHPDNLPFSAQDESGFDNKIARELANELGARLEYTWYEPQHGLVRKTLGEHRCDVLFGLPQGYDGVLASVPYYTSRYVFIYRNDRPQPLASFDHPALRSSRIGVQIVGDDMATTPAGHALAMKGVKHVVGFPVYGDRPAVARMASAIARGDLDAGVAWGPAAGYFAAKEGGALAVEPAIAPTGLELPFEFAITLGVRRSDKALKEALDAAIEHRHAAIHAILRSYHVPLVTALSNVALNAVRR
jgi:mxaJ protein